MHLQNIIDAVVKGVLLGLFMAISVGPTLFAIIKYSLKLSYKAGIAFVLGVSVSDILYVIIANAAANWLQVLRGFDNYIAYIGGALLVIIGLVGIFKKQKDDGPAGEDFVITNRHYFNIWLGGFMVNTINPAVIFWWLSAVTATANMHLTYRIILFGTCLGLVLSIDFSKVFLAEAIRRKLTTNVIGLLHKLSALILLIIGLLLILSTAFNLHIVKG